MKTKTIEEKRIEILKDVLKHIKSRRILGSKGKAVLQFDTEEDISECDLQKVLKSMSRNKYVCKVCVRGGLLYSAVWKNNNLSVEWKTHNLFSGKTNTLRGIAGSEDDEHEKYINELFSKEQQKLMERAFERQFHIDNLTVEELDACNEFHDKYPNDTQRITAIVKNAIKNGGIFIP